MSINNNLFQKDDIVNPEAIDSSSNADKLIEFAQFLKGKGIFLKGQEKKFIEKQRKILDYRRIIVTSIREFAIEYGETSIEAGKIIDRFELILDEIADDITKENTEIMG